MSGCSTCQHFCGPGLEAAQTRPTAASAGLHKSQDRVCTLPGWTRLQHMPARAQTGWAMLSWVDAPTCIISRTGNRPVRRTLGTPPTGLWVPLLSARERVGCKPCWARLQYIASCSLVWPAMPQDLAFELTNRSCSLAGSSSSSPTRPTPIIRSHMCWHVLCPSLSWLACSSGMHW